MRKQMNDEMHHKISQKIYYYQELGHFHHNKFKVLILFKYFLKFYILKEVYKSLMKYWNSMVSSLKGSFGHFLVEFHEFFISASHVIGHVEVNVGVVDLFQTHKQPEQMAQKPPDSHHSPPLFPG